MAAERGTGGLVCGCGEGAADGLDDEGEEVAGHEDPGVEGWFEEGELGADGADEVFECYVNRCCEERLSKILSVGCLKVEG